MTQLHEQYCVDWDLLGHELVVWYVLRDLSNPAGMTEMEELLHISAQTARGSLDALRRRIHNARLPPSVFLRVVDMLGPWRRTLLEPPLNRILRRLSRQLPNLTQEDLAELTDEMGPDQLEHLVHELEEIGMPDLDSQMGAEEG